MRHLCLLLALLLAGCAAPAAPVDDPVAGPAPASTAAAPEPVLAEFGCRTVVVALPEPPGWSEGRIPEGAATASILQTKAWSCASATLDGREIGETAHAIFYMPVDGPWGSNLFHVFRWVTSNAEAATLLASWNLPVEVGDVRFDVTGTPAAQRIALRAQGEGFLIEEDSATGVALSNSAYEARYLGVRDGKVVNAIDIPVFAHRVAAFGPATARVEGADSPFGTPVAAGATHQLWEAEEPSYEWRYAEV